MALLFILNPGDGCDVLTMRDEARAVATLNALRKATPSSYARLYSRGARGAFQEYFREYAQFFPVDRTALPLKVLEAGRK